MQEQRESRPMTLDAAREICISVTCYICGSEPGRRCNNVGAVPNAGKPAFTFHAERWKNTGHWPFMITDV